MGDAMAAAFELEVDRAVVEAGGVIEGRIRAVKTIDSKSISVRLYPTAGPREGFSSLRRLTVTLAWTIASRRVSTVPNAGLARVPALE